MKAKKEFQLMTFEVTFTPRLDIELMIPTNATAEQVREMVLEKAEEEFEEHFTGLNDYTLNIDMPGIYSSGKFGKLKMGVLNLNSR